MITSRKYFEPDTRLSLLYIAGKPEPMCMSLSAQSHTARLFKIHLHKILPPYGSCGKNMQPSEAVVLEELFRRDVNDLLNGHPAFEDKTKKHSLIPVDVSADLACSSRHPWINTVIKESALSKIHMTMGFPVSAENWAL